MLPPALGPYASFADWLKDLPGYSDQLRFARRIPGRPMLPVSYQGIFGDILGVLGLRPWAHQAEAFSLLEGGYNVVVASPTASGKSLVFQIPALHALLQGQAAIFLYPTKALARDQSDKLTALAAPFGLAGQVQTYDGDTPTNRRAKIREQGLGFLTNPDMLHYGLLPRHSDWARVLTNLAYIVVDELHYYRGVFGTHVGLILRRLLRLARFYGAEPKLIGVSATIQNPLEHAQTLFGERFALVEAQARTSEREFTIWLPRALDKTGQSRRSVNLEAAGLAVYAAESGVKTLVFASSRRTAELIGRYGQMAGGEIRTYRAGYTTAERTQLEQAFREGRINVLASTSALELGIDIGDLDAVILVGYPGSLNAFWQRAGRAGRSGRRALLTWIPREDPLDEYFLNHPELLLTSAPEAAVADPFNPYLYPPHLHAAARELPLDKDEPLYRPELSGPGFKTWGGHIHTTRRNPHRDISLRGSGKSFVLKDASGKVMGYLDQRQAYREAHPGAVYLHQGESYLVRNLDLLGQEVVLLPSLEAYYTQVLAETDITVQDGHEVRPGVWLGRVTITDQVVGFAKKRYLTEAVLDEVPLELPPITYPTEAIWFHPSQLEDPGLMAGGIHALEHTLIGLLPLFVLAERSDIGGVSYPLYPGPLPSGSGATIFIYDGHPGGVGYVAQAAHSWVRWLSAAHDLLTDCPCDDGCPRCILSPKCGNGNQFLDKDAALLLATSIVEANSQTVN